MKRRTFSVEFKRSAVAWVVEQSYTLAQAVLQIRAAQLSQDDRADRLWAMPRPYRAARHKPIPAVA